MPDAGPHPSLLLAEFSPAFAGFLDAHAVLQAVPSFGRTRPALDPARGDPL
jgi:hypothetical protein